VVPKSARFAGIEKLTPGPGHGETGAADANSTKASHIPAEPIIRWRKLLDSIDQLIADWIQVRATLKRQLKHFAEGNTIALTDQVSGRLTKTPPNVCTAASPRSRS